MVIKRPKNLSIFGPLFHSGVQKSKNRKITAVFDRPNLPPSLKMRCTTLKLNQALMYGHEATKKIWAFLDHFITYSNFSFIFKVARRGRRNSKFVFFAILTWKRFLSPFYIGNMSDFHFWTVYTNLLYQVTFGGEDTVVNERRFLLVFIVRWFSGKRNTLT